MSLIAPGQPAEDLARVMLDAAPWCCLLWTRDYEILDCNETAVEMFGFSNKQEFIEKFNDASPKYQPDGQLSWHKGRMHLVKAFEEGRSVFDWTHKLPDGTLMPAEIALVRARYKGEFVVVGYTRDLRQIRRSDNSTLRLESDTEAIYYDPLTGIFNRRYFDESMTRVLKTLSRSFGVLSILMIDIDFFKNYNDKYGYNAGDDCLRIIADALSKSVTRADDFVVRYGVEEFAVVLPNTNEDGARLLADNMLQAVRECGIPHERSDAADIVTVSIGVTTGTVQPKSRADNFIIRADELLYMSKQNGRNRSTYGRM